MIDNIAKLLLTKKTDFNKNFSSFYLSNIKSYSEKRKYNSDGLKDFYNETGKDLYKTEKHYRSLIENAEDVISLINAEGKTIYVSPAIEKVTGFTTEERNLHQSVEIIFPDDREKAQQLFNTVLNNPGTPTSYTFRLMHKNGTAVWVEGTLTNLLHDENVKAVVSNYHDITERKEAEEQIKNSEQRYRTLFEQNLAGVYQSTIHGVILNCNEAFAKMLKYDSPAELLQVNAFELYFSPAERNDFINSVIDQKKLHNYEGVLRCKDGSSLYVIENISLRKDAISGEEICNGILIDITGKKYAEDELKKLSLIAKQTINGVVIRDKQQNVVWVNNAFTKMYGYELEEITGKNPLNFLQGPETNPDTINYVRKQLTNKEPFVFEVFYYAKDGEKKYVRIQVQPIFDDNGDIKQSFAFHTDITRHRKLEEKVELEKIIKQKEITDAVYAAQENERSEIGKELHDNVNQLLGAARLYIDMAITNEEKRELLLTNASAYTLNAIEEIRKLSKTLITPLIKEIGLVDSVKDLGEEVMLVQPIKVLLSTENFAEAGLNDKFKLNIFRIVQEQINNILKHAKAKNIYINIEGDQSAVSVSITDDGIGFNTAKRRSGVGLTNIKSRSELYNGNMELTSIQGKGTSLLLTFNKTHLL